MARRPTKQPTSELTPAAKRWTFALGSVALVITIFGYASAVISGTEANELRDLPTAAAELEQEITTAAVSLMVGTIGLLMLMACAVFWFARRRPT